MDSPINIGDLTTNSIQHHLDSTHLHPSSTSVVPIKSFTYSLNSAIYNSIKLIQLTINLTLESESCELIILRRVQDSFINVSQLLQILVKLGYFTNKQVNNFLNNQVVDNLEYNNEYLDWRTHQDTQLQGVWITYDKAVSICLKFDIYEFVKQLFLIDVHEFENLTKINKRQQTQEESVLASPTKKQKVEVEFKKIDIEENPNYPHTLAPVALDNFDDAITTDLKVKLGEIFKRDEQESVSLEEISSILQSTKIIKDIPLDNKGQTSLHFAATLASINLVSAFIELGVNSPIRGNNLGESPLVSTIQVTNSMEQGNFLELLTNWLYPNLLLFDNNNQSILHHLILVDNCKFYTTKIVEFLLENDQYLYQFKLNIVNSQDIQGNTPLHLAIERENKWMIRILVEFGADLTIANKSGIVPDLELADQDSEPIFQLIKTSLEFLNKRGDITIPQPNTNNSSKIFQSIQQLLNNTNDEYDSILNSKRQQIKSLDKSLHDITIVTGNNRFVVNKIKSKLVELDNLKLQIANITDKLIVAKQQSEEQEEVEDPYIIQPLYDRIKNHESIEDLKENPEFIQSLDDQTKLRARIKAYMKINEKLTNELAMLNDYNELTGKFKKVVSICTGVDINEVDELLDGLLQAVETNTV
ncbi:Regulatory protein SWI6 [Spathaspora sp. JA1]|nr:Regulatory protein SWI6 [Spathaspora sp. JA1]